MLPDMQSSSDEARLAHVSAARWRVAITLTIAMFVVYIGFILLVAFDKPLLSSAVRPGLSVGILLGVLVIVTAWGLVAAYVVWANRYYDHVLADLRERR
jgi:uncharacterized membrane protein (DUF485 family)